MPFRTFLVALASLPLGGGSWAFTDELVAGPTIDAVCLSPVPEFKMTSQVVVMRSHDGLFRLPIGVSGATTEAIVDTGATRTVMSSKTFRHIAERSASRANPGLMRGFGGSIAYARERLHQVQIAGKPAGSIDIAVIDNADSPTVIGQDILSTLGPITIDGDRLILG